MIECEYKATSKEAPPGETHYRCVHKGCDHDRTSRYEPKYLHRPCDVQSDGGTLTRRLGRYVMEVKKWRDAGKPIRDDAAVESLLVICKACDHYDPRGKCVLCSCRVNVGQTAIFNKLRMATTQCPAEPPKWNADVEVDESRG